jgi:glycosyltransferase involved in cell wall biosynthesis
MTLKPLSPLEHVVLVNDTSEVRGGASQVAVAEAILLASRGFRVTFVAGDSGSGSPLKEHPGIDLMPLGLPPVGEGRSLSAMREALWSERAVRGLGEVLDGLPADRSMVHVHAFRNHLTPSVFEASRQRGYPTVYTSHDYGIGCPIGGFYNYRKGCTCRLRGSSSACLLTSCSFLPYPRKLWASVRHRVQRDRGGLPASLDAILFVSEFSRAVLLPYLSDRPLARVVPNPVEQMSGRPERRPIPDTARFLYVGRLTREKDPLTFARAAAEIGACATLAGEGPLAEEVARIAPDASLVGWVPQEELAPLFRSSLALVFPSRLMETQGLSVYEAAAHGVPTLVSDAAAASEWVERFGAGLVFRSGDSADLADKMRQMMDPVVADACSSKAYEALWSDPPTPERHVERLLDVYREVRETRPRG